MAAPSETVENGTQLSDKAKSFIETLKGLQLSKLERLRFLNLIDVFYPYNRRPFQEGDVVLYRLLGLSELFQAMSAAEALAIRQAIADLPDGPGIGLPEDLVFVVPRPPQADECDAAYDSERFATIPPAQRQALFDILFELTDRLSDAPELTYSQGERKTAFALRDWLFALALPQDDEDDLAPDTEETMRFYNELRQLLVETIVGALMHERRA
jgi:hypothetical protein